MMTKEGVHSLIRELEDEVTVIDRLQQQNLRAWSRLQMGSKDTLDVGALAFSLHTIYGVLEDYFLRVNRFFENDLPTDHWHKVLVESMARSVEALRPALLTTPGLKWKAMGWMEFRNRVRHLRGEELGLLETREAQTSAWSFLLEVPKIHEEFASKLRVLAEELP